MYRILSAQKEQQYLLAQEFVLPHEKYCCSLMQKIILRERFIYLISSTPDASCIQDIAGVFCFTDGELLLPCLPFQNSEIFAVLLRFFHNLEVFCISGSEQYVAFLMEILRHRGGQQLKEERHLYLMEYREPYGAQIHTPQGYSVIRCTQGDAGRLMRLHLSYMTEEVLPAGVQPYPPSERMELERTLRSQIVLALKADSETSCIPAKAQTNAICHNYIQIGGVFTAKPFRGNGFATCLVASLAQSAAKSGRKSVLFVNHHNTCAIRAYRRAGFSTEGEYLIIYYEDKSS